jgi:hypothetical protein
MRQNDELDEHARFRELCALSSRNLLSVHEQKQLDDLLQSCDSCRLLKREYSVVGEQGMAVLLAEESLTAEAKSWDNRAARERLLSSIGAKRSHPMAPFQFPPSRRAWNVPPSISRTAAFAALAACAVMALMVWVYRTGWRAGTAAQRASSLAPQALVAPPVQKAPAADDAAARSAQIVHLQRQLAEAEENLAQLRAAAITAEKRVEVLEGSNGKKDADLRQVAAERDQLVNDLAEKEKAYQTLQTEYSTLRGDQERSLLHTASMEAEVKDLQAVNQTLQSRLKDDDQYLTSDRDIRELMGARKLYIADVFDVDGASRTRKPFGRVFYTENKSLIFYAFDLDHQAGVKNASVFQVWGERDSENKDAAHPMNLGILYMDSETNRRWVLRSDDPKQLAEIDAVFVTVEPHGGSQKPTGKPLLYALLRKEANHP